MSAIFFTGAPATGKTTIISELVQQGAVLLPRHTTRSPRPNDLEGEYEYLDSPTLLGKFLIGDYLEQKINTLFFGGCLYATPIDWVSDTLINSEELRVASSPSLEVARCLMQLLPRNALWIHLFSPVDERERRLITRGISSRELNYRLTVGENGIHGQLKEATDNIDTSKYSVQGVTYLILQLAGKQLEKGGL